MSREGTTGSSTSRSPPAGGRPFPSISPGHRTGRRDVDPRDNSLNDIRLRRSAGGAPADVFFGHLRFDEQTGYDALGVEHDLLAAYARSSPTVLGLVGTELSLGPHLNQFGGPRIRIPTGRCPPGAERRDPASIVDFVHTRAASRPSTILPAGRLPAADDGAGVARDLLPIGAGRADMLEVGFGPGTSTARRLPGGVGHPPATAFITANGASDDHTGYGWATRRTATTPGRGRRPATRPALLGALAAGSAYVDTWAGSAAPSTWPWTPPPRRHVPMGAVSISAEVSRPLSIDVTALPAGGAVQVVRGDVDRAGPLAPHPAAGRGDAGRDRPGRVERAAVATSDDCFVRLQVLDATGDRRLRSADVGAQVRPRHGAGHAADGGLTWCGCRFAVLG